MSPKTSERGGPAAGKSGGRGGPVTSSRGSVVLLAVLVLILGFENTRATRIRILLPEVTMPLWMALLATGVIGALCGAYSVKRRR